MDEYIDSLLNEEHIFEISLPKIPKRSVLEDNGELSPYVSVLENELNVDRNKKEEKSESESETEEEKDIDIFKNLKIPENFFKNKKRKRSEDKDEKKDRNKHKNDGQNKNEKIEIKKNNNENIKTQENNQEKTEKIKLPDLDPESDEYWLELRKRIGID